MVCHVGPWHNATTHVEFWEYRFFLGRNFVTLFPYYMKSIRSVWWGPWLLMLLVLSCQCVVIKPDRHAGLFLELSGMILHHVPPILSYKALTALDYASCQPVRWNCMVIQNVSLQWWEWSYRIKYLGCWYSMFLKNSGNALPQKMVESKN
jgi:hypothetical protein